MLGEACKPYILDFVASKSRLIVVRKDGIIAGIYKNFALETGRKKNFC